MWYFQWVYLNVTKSKSTLSEGDEPMLLLFYTPHLSQNTSLISLIWKFLEDFNVWICPLSYSITCRITILFLPHCLNIFNIVLATSLIRDHTDKTEEWRSTNIDLDFSLCYHCCPVKILNAMQNKKLHNATNTVWWCRIPHHKAFSSNCSKTVPLPLNITLEYFRCRCHTMEDVMRPSERLIWNEGCQTIVIMRGRKLTDVVASQHKRTPTSVKQPVHPHSELLC